MLLKDVTKLNKNVKKLCNESGFPIDYSVSDKRMKRLDDKSWNVSKVGIIRKYKNYSVLLSDDKKKVIVNEVKKIIIELGYDIGNFDVDIYRGYKRVDDGRGWAGHKKDCDVLRIKELFVMK